MAETKEIKSIEITQDKPEEFESNFPDTKEKIERPSRGSEKQLNSGNGSIAVRDDGQVNLAAGLYSQTKLTPSGTIENISFQQINKTNRFKVEADDVIINNHKLNNKIYEMADYKRVLQQEYDTNPCIAGGITMLGTVLVKAWDLNLKRYVLIRRLINMPLFSPSLGAVDVHPGIKITPNTSRIKSMQEAFNTSGITSMDQYIAQSRQSREQANQERQQLEAQQNAATQSARTDTYVSSTTLTGQGSSPVTKYSPNKTASNATQNNTNKTDNKESNKEKVEKKKEDGK